MGTDLKITSKNTYTYNGLDMVTHINYNGGEEVSYQCNKVGDLKEANDWTGNQTSVKYPDNTTATKTYDLLGNIKTVIETDGRTTTYTYDGMNRGKNNFIQWWYFTLRKNINTIS